MKKVIFMGKTGSGKTTLCQKLDKLDVKYKKTQSVDLYNNSIDTPGEYMENRYMYSALNITATDAEVIALVYDPTQGECYISPGFSSMFCKDVIGIITKIKKCESSINVQIGRERLEMAGVSKIFEVDTIEEIGLEELFNYIG
ncbi:EutP/PduV family microcompartment system protein [Romboutsia sp.]|uniref:EutP/PduV family microcompartment system protein n=1 Tax=Romboutsia sp. TaxID=1965302 RepID=UPI003F395388